MRKYIKTIAAGSLMAVLFCFTSFGMTVGELKTAHKQEFTSGTGSVYGPALNQEQLDAVAGMIADFVNKHITEGMTEEEKIRTIHTYLFQTVSYAEDWAKNSANTAYGALINHTAQCSGYARAFKAMCDAVGIECYYVKADQYAFNSNHQWNIVKYNGQYYHMDVQENSLGKGGDSTYLSAKHICSYVKSDYPQVASEDAPVQRYYNADGPYTLASENITVNEFPGPDRIWMNIVSQQQGRGMADYGVCQALRLPEDAKSIVIMPESPYDESKYNLQMAIIPYKGRATLEKGVLYLALEGDTLTNFQYLKKGQEVSLDPLGLGRSGPELARYCRDNDIFFELVIFDENAYRKFEKEHGQVTIDNLVHDIPGMSTWLTY